MPAVLLNSGPAAAHASSDTPTASSALLDSGTAAAHASAHITTVAPSVSAPGPYLATIYYVLGGRVGKMAIPDDGLLFVSKMQENLELLE